MHALLPLAHSSFDVSIYASDASVSDAWNGVIRGPAAGDVSRIDNLLSE